MTGDDLTVSSLLAAARYLGDSLPSPNVLYLRLYGGRYHIRYIKYQHLALFTYISSTTTALLKHTTIPASESETPSKLSKNFHDVLHSSSMSPPSTQSVGRMHTVPIISISGLHSQFDSFSPSAVESQAFTGSVSSFC